MLNIIRRKLAKHVIGQIRHYSLTSLPTTLPTLLGLHAQNGVEDALGCVNLVPANDMISICPDGSDPWERKQMRGVRLSDSSHVASRSKITLSAYCSPNAPTVKSQCLPKLGVSYEPMHLMSHQMQSLFAIRNTL
ncbi:hypothetical protein E2C01_036140 [Portunus trituberculatus]|uniref:Uncharacterized protein n=1 Tax=Portunus trituberculatus TaxID=210409 RepID=A0A5B7FB88_PORTR|nr:hypothetical protein [Portunus trituberculatus]